MKRNRLFRIIVTGVCCCLATTVMADDDITLANGIIDTTQHATLGLKPARGMETITVFSPTDVSDHYTNGVVLTALVHIISLLADGWFAATR